MNPRPKTLKFSFFECHGQPQRLTFCVNAIDSPDTNPPVSFFPSSVPPKASPDPASRSHPVHPTFFCTSPPARPVAPTFFPPLVPLKATSPLPPPKFPPLQSRLRPGLQVPYHPPQDVCPRPEILFFPPPRLSAINLTSFSRPGCDLFFPPFYDKSCSL